MKKHVTQISYSKIYAKFLKDSPIKDYCINFTLGMNSIRGRWVLGCTLLFLQMNVFEIFRTTWSFIINFLLFFEPLFMILTNIYAYGNYDFCTHNWLTKLFLFFFSTFWHGIVLKFMLGIHFTIMSSNWLRPMYTKNLMLVCYGSGRKKLYFQLVKRKVS